MDQKKKTKITEGKGRNTIYYFWALVISSLTWEKEKRERKKDVGRGAILRTSPGGWRGKRGGKPYG